MVIMLTLDKVNASITLFSFARIIRIEFTHNSHRIQPANDSNVGCIQIEDYEIGTLASEYNNY